MNIYVYDVASNQTKNGDLTEEYVDKLQLLRGSGTILESEPNNYYNQADITYDDFDNYGAIESSIDVDWWYVYFTSPGNANFWLGNIPSGCDYDIQLYDNSGTTLLAQSSFSGNADELITWAVQANTIYYIKIIPFYGSSPSNYWFRAKNYATSISPDFYEPNDSYYNATALIPNPTGYLTANIHTATDMDFYIFSITQNVNLQALLSNIPNGTYQITLIKSDQSVSYYNYGTPYSPAQINATLTPGNYYIIINMISGTPSASYYRLDLATTSIFTPLSGVYTIKNSYNSLYITVQSAYNATGQNIYVNSSASADATRNGQRMRIKYDPSNSAYTIAPICSYNGFYRVLDILKNNNPLTAGQRVETCEPEYPVAQLFILESLGGNNYRIRMKYDTNLVLDLSGSNVIINQYNASSATQIWYLEEDSVYNAEENYYKNLAWIFPCSTNETYHLSSSYGYRYQYWSNPTDVFHQGIDIAPNTQRYLGKALSVTNGTMTSYYSSARGNYIAVTSNTNVYNTYIPLIIVYQHLKDPSNYSNTTVNIGNDLGYIGTTGDSEGIHLHLTVVKNGDYNSYAYENTLNPLTFYYQTTFSY